MVPMNSAVTVIVAAEIITIFFLCWLLAFSSSTRYFDSPSSMFWIVFMITSANSGSYDEVSYLIGNDYRFSLGGLFAFSTWSAS